MTPTTKKAAIYIRVSLADGSQDATNQLPEARQLAEARNFDVVEVYSDQTSGIRHRRPGLDRLLSDARRGKFSAMFVWSLDRLGRGYACLDTFRTLASYGVKVVSVREGWCEAEGPALTLLVSVMAFIGSFERERLVERTRAGMDRARRQGKQIGRPRAQVDLQKALQLRQQGLGLRPVARAVGCSTATLSRLLAGARALGVDAAASPSNGAGAVATSPFQKGLLDPALHLPGIPKAA